MRRVARAVLLAPCSWRASISYVSLEVGGCVADVVIIAEAPGEQRRAEHRPLRIEPGSVEELAVALQEAGAAGVRTAAFDSERCAVGPTSITASVDYFRPVFVPGLYRVNSFSLGLCRERDGADRVWQVLKRWADAHVEPGLLH